MYNCAAGCCLRLVIPVVDSCDAAVDESVNGFVLGGIVFWSARSPGWLSPLSANYHQGGAIAKTGRCENTRL